MRKWAEISLASHIQLTFAQDALQELSGAITAVSSPSEAVGVHLATITGILAKAEGSVPATPAKGSDVSVVQNAISQQLSDVSNAVQV